MLIRFSTGNYLSFRDRVIFSMEAASIKGYEDTNFVEGTRILISSAIYGANASGKSNLLKAMSFMKRFIRSSSRESQSGDPIPVEPFRLNTSTEKRPSFFEIEFIIHDTQYRYGFEVDTDRIHTEWLFYTSPKKGREYRLFTRTQDKYEVARKFKEGIGIEKLTRSNALFLSVVAQFNGELAQQILLWFSQKLAIISGLDDSSLMFSTFSRLKEKHYQEIIPRLLEGFDLGFADVKVKDKPLSATPPPDSFPDEIKKFLSNVILSSSKDVTELSLHTIHKKYNEAGEHVADEEFSLETNESEGTKKIVALACFLIDALFNGVVLIVDELDARLHPLLTKKIISLFHFPRLNHGAQFVFTTHDTNLLSNKMFRRDQIWFTEKDSYGGSDLYSLVEYKIDDQKIRNDASFEKDYLLGKYGAIPFVGDFHQLLVETDYEKE